MLQRQAFQDHRPEGDSDQVFSLSHLYDILRRRAFFFVVIFILISAIGSLVSIAWPARYLSQGKILISSQEIPSDLVRPTVGTLANERIQVIEQRIFTRDNLLGLAKKFQLTSGWQGAVLGTEIVDFVKDRIQIKPLELTLQGDRKGAIAFTVGFDYEQPVIAMKVANELVTMILNEDVRSRTNFAAETTKFLEQEVDRLQKEISLADAQIVEYRDRKTDDLNDASPSDDAKEIAALRAELLLKSATFSETHPDIIALKRKIAAFKRTTPNVSDKAGAPQKADVQKKVDKAVTSQKSGAPTNVADVVGIDAIELKRQSLKTELTSARQKLTAARLGENLERGQHSERLEVIEQATIPPKPASPNRPRMFGISFAFALMAAGGLVFAGEALNPAIRRSADLYSVIDSHLIVSIPHISTLREVRRRRRSILLIVGTLVALVVAALIVGYLVLPPIDVLFAKAMTAMFK